MNKHLFAVGVLLFCLVVMAACSRTPSQTQLEVRLWTTADGTPVPPRLIQMRNGPEHCGWQEAWFLTTRNPGDTELESVTQNPRQFILDPAGVVNSTALKTTYSNNAELPSDASFTGYVSDGAELWISEPMLDTAVFLVSETRVERLPLVLPPVFCE